MTTDGDLSEAPGGPGIRRPGNRQNPDGSMPLMEHLRELRNRVFKMALIIAVGAIAGWILYPHIFHFIEGPFCRLPAGRESLKIYHPSGTGVAACRQTLIVNGLFDALFLHIKIAIIAGVILTSPLWLYQLWAFVAPGLYARERRCAYFFAGSAVPLFLIGGVLAYFAMTRGLHFLLSQVPNGVQPLITIDTYIGYFMAMLGIFAIAFELPLVLVMLNMAHVLTHDRFRRWRRGIIFCVFLFAAVFTPSPDPLSMLLLAVPCVVLVEVAEVVIYFNDRRRARIPDPYAGLADDEAAPLEMDENDPADTSHLN
jgi:sec-independent protein translocase protein TatC